MLVLTVRVGEKACVGYDVEVEVLSVRGAQVKLGFSAPRSVVIDRAAVRQRRLAGGWTAAELGEASR